MFVHILVITVNPKLSISIHTSVGVGVQDLCLIRLYLWHRMDVK